ncbi:hypothetical protein, partial [Klebsiella pneumoniae]|uniref:hypothetical protein n=1 Tax=Klebsiella pneumoniae TaxID=573 RepID=UPI000AD4752C
PSSRMLTPQRVDDFTLTVPYNDDLHPDDWIMDDPDIDLPKLLFWALLQIVGGDKLIIPFC